MPDLQPHRRPEKNLIVYFRGMRILRRTVPILFGSLLLEACLEAPDAPQIFAETPRISVCMFQNDTLCKIELQASPSDSFTLRANVFPESLFADLRFTWKRSPDEVLKEGSEFATDTSRVPDSLIASDRYGNRISEPLDFIFDSPPKFLDETVPEENDTLYGDASTAFLFAYGATDADPEDTLAYTVLLDSASFDAGTLTRFFQSGFAPGIHTFRVFVEDRYGLRDSTEIIRFFVVENEP